ncbi:MAG: ribbon-helix-helix domain-containing protein [Patescibacteria group bacterium]
MRNTSLVTISLPPAMVKESERLAKNKQMTRSEFMRAAIRRFIEELDTDEAIRIVDEELAAGKLKLLPRGGLAKLMSK